MKVTVNDLLYVLRSDDPGGGPLSGTEVIRVQISLLRRKMVNTSWRIPHVRQWNAGYKLASVHEKCVRVAPSASASPDTFEALEARAAREARPMHEIVGAILETAARA